VKLAASGFRPEETKVRSFGETFAGGELLHGVGEYLATIGNEGAMLEETMRWFGSKIDWWLGLILWLPPIVPFVACFALATSGKPAELPIGIAACVFVVALYAGVVFPVTYGVDEGRLIVRFGLCRVRIPLSEISEIYPTRSPLSSPALSIDRLHVQFGKGKWVMISPADRDGFLDHVAKQAGLKRDGDRLVRK
jgi:hypothetical protein